jgi:hypothetical protein
MRWSSALVRAVVLVAASVMFLACDATSPAPTGTVGTWTLASPMHAPRAGHNMTLLKDGRVLVAGGQPAMFADGSGPALDSAELYDPVAGTWTVTGSMGTPRMGHLALLLEDGRVLAAGGCTVMAGASGYGTSLASAELYDPATGTWSATGDMLSTDGSAVLLPDGKVLKAGAGTGIPGESLTTSGHSELYDPATGSWTETGSMNVARNWPAMALLPSGLVLAVGGAVDNIALTAAAELYDPSTGTWRMTAQFGYPVAGPTMTLLPTGKVLLAGGSENYFTYLADSRRTVAQLYDPASETWHDTGPMTYRQVMTTAVRLASGQVLLSGGNFFDRTPPEGGGAGWYPARGGDVYDPWLDTWTPTPTLPHYVMFGSAAVLLPGGDVLVTGGSLWDGTVIDPGETGNWGHFVFNSSAQRFSWHPP